MACGAPALWVALLLIGIGVVVAVLAVVPWFVIPDRVEKEVADLAVIDSPDDDNFDDFVNPTENPLVYNCYFWNITNYDAVRTSGARPNLVAVGPYVYKKYTHRFNITFSNDGELFSYQEWADYNYSAEESFAGADPVNDFSWTVNVAWLAGLPAQRSSESQLLAQVAANAIATFKPSLIDSTHLIKGGFLNSAWATVFSQLKLLFPGGFPAMKGAWQADVAPATILDESDVWKGLLDSGRGALVDILFNESVSGSLTDPNFFGQLTWTNSTAKVQSLLTTYASFNLTLPEASAIFGYRATPYGKRPGGPLPGAGFYGFVMEQVIALRGLTSSLPSPFNVSDPSTWNSFEDNVAWLHFGSSTAAYSGLFNNASLIENPAAAAQAAALYNNIPELSIWVARSLQNYFAQEGVSAFPERNVLKTPLLFPVNDSKWIFDTFGNTAIAPFPFNTTTIGVLLTNLFVSFFPQYLRSFPLVSPAFTAGNFTQLQETWAPSSFPGFFASFMNSAGPRAGLSNTTGSAAQALGLNRPLSFLQAYQIYAWIRWNFMDGFAIDLIYDKNGGPIIKQSPHQWLFGRAESFFSFAFNRTVPVGGIWSDFTPELGAQNNFIETYTTGKADPQKFREQITYNGNSSLAKYFPSLQPSPVVVGSSLTFVGPYRLVSKTGSKKTDQKFYLWVPDVVRELELIYKEESSLFGIDLFRFEANARYKSVVKDTNYINPYDFVMDNKIKYTNGAYEFYLTYPGWTLVKETDLFHDKVDGVQANEDEFSLYWDFEPITGITMRARAPLQLSLPLNHDSKFSTTGTFNILGRRLPTATHIPTWYIIRTNQIKKSQAEDWKESIGAAKAAQLGITTALAAVGGVIFLVGLALLLWRLIGGAREDMQEFELRN